MTYTNPSSIVSSKTVEVSVFASRVSLFRTDLTKESKRNRPLPKKPDPIADTKKSLSIPDSSAGMLNPLHYSAVF